MDIATLFPFLDGTTIELLIKLPVLALLFLYAIFALILLNKTKSLSKLIFIERSIASILLNGIALLHTLAAVLLFLLALVIL